MKSQIVRSIKFNSINGVGAEWVGELPHQQHPPVLRRVVMVGDVNPCNRIIMWIPWIPGRGGGWSYVANNYRLFPRDTQGGWGGR